MTRISIVSSWLCSTGVAVISSYCILTHHQNTPVEQKKAAADAARIHTRCNTGVNYYTVRPKVHAKAVKRKAVY